MTDGLSSPLALPQPRAGGERDVGVGGGEPSVGHMFWQRLAGSGCRASSMLWCGLCIFHGDCVRAASSRRPQADFI